MATQTPNYGLHQWEPSDNFLRTDFNTDLQKIDTALGQKAEQTALEELADVVNGKPEFVKGSYTGNGSTQTISLGFQPSVVITGSTDNIHVSTSAVPGNYCSITSNGFRVTCYENYGGTLNRTDVKYLYLAYR